MLLAAGLATNEAPMVDDIACDPDVSPAASEDDDCVCDASGAAPPSVDALRLAELFDFDAATWLLRVASADVAVEAVVATVES